MVFLMQSMHILAPLPWIDAPHKQHFLESIIAEDWDVEYIRHLVSVLKLLIGEW